MSRLRKGNALLCLFSAVLFLAGCAAGQRELPEKTVPTGQRGAFRVVAYAPTYSLERIAPGDYEHVTDVVVFSAELTATGGFCEESAAALPVAYFGAIKQEHGVRIHLCFGGWGRSRGFAEMTGDPAKRAVFVGTVLQWCLANSFDGVDYDWEFPANDAEHAAYGSLLEETAEAFRPHGLRVSVALGHTQSLEQAAYDAVDAIHLMTYDMGLRHATERDAVSAVRRLLRSGARSDKIVLGTPFYGRRLDDRDVAMAYEDILSRFAPRPDEDEAGGFYFNNVETIRRKTRYALEHGLAGIMIWELSMDTDDETSLLRSIQQELSK